MGAQWAQAAGYEKPTLYGARASALGGVGSLIANSAEALSFNPGMIASGRKGWVVSLNVSPIKSNLSGPWNNDNLVVESSPQSSLSAAGMLAYNFNDHWAVSIGRYAVGGGKTVYDDVVYRGFSDTLDLYSDIKISEIGVGVGYRLNDQWSFGVASRKTTYEASYTRPARALLGLAVGAADFRDLKDETQAGYRLGVHFKPNARLRASFVYRSPVDIGAKGLITGGKIITPVIGMNIDPGDVLMKTTLPQSYTLGLSYRWDKDWQSFLEWSSTNYSTVRTVEIESTSSDVGNRSNIQNWKDQTLIKVGLEYTNWFMPIRIGYNHTSPVTDADYSNPLQYPPTALQSFSIGTGIRFSLFKNPARVDFSMDQTEGSGEGGTAPVDGDYSNDFRAGRYGIKVFATHLSFVYFFGQENEAKSEPKTDAVSTPKTASLLL